MLEQQADHFWLTWPGHGLSHSLTEYSEEKHSFSDSNQNIIPPPTPPQPLFEHDNTAFARVFQELLDKQHSLFVEIAMLILRHLPNSYSLSSFNSKNYFFLHIFKP